MEILFGILGDMLAEMFGGWTAEKMQRRWPVFFRVFRTVCFALMAMVGCAIAVLFLVLGGPVDAAAILGAAFFFACAGGMVYFGVMAWRQR